MSILFKTLVIDIANNWGSNYYHGLRSVDFYLNDVKLQMTSGFSAGASSSALFSYFDAHLVFYTPLSKEGSWNDTAWLSGSMQNSSRLIIIFDTRIAADKIVINNSHSSGNETNSGARNTTISISTHPYIDLTYLAEIPNSTVVFSGEIPQHVAQDVEDPFEIILPVESVDTATGAVGLNTFVNIDAIGYQSACGHANTQMKATVGIDAKAHQLEGGQGNIPLSLTTEIESNGYQLAGGQGHVTVNAVVGVEALAHDKEIFKHEYFASPWIETIWTGFDKPEDKVPFPVCDHIEMFSNRIIGSIGNQLIYSENGLYGIYDAFGNVLNFPSRITMIRAVEGGLFVSDSKQVYYLVGNNPSKWNVQNRVCDSPTVEWCDCWETVDASDFGFPESTAKVAVFLTRKGFMFGFPEGNVVDLTSKSYKLDPKKIYRGISCKDGLVTAVSEAGGLIVQTKVGDIGKKAVTEFTGAFQGVGIHNDEDFLVGFEGLYKPNKNKYGVFKFTTPATNFGINRNKKCRFIYLEIDTTPPLTIRTKADSTGWKTYRVKNVKSGPQRLKFPVCHIQRGDYWSFEIVSENFFRLDSMSALITTLAN